MKSIYSTADLAEMFEVNESTVKRWSDQGHIECLKTVGGHRRFLLRSVLAFVHKNKLSVAHLDAQLLNDTHLRSSLIQGDVSLLLPQLRDAMMAGDANEVLRVLRIGIVAKPDLLHLYHHLIFPPMEEIGDRWERGEITVDREHLASSAVHDALHRLGPELYYKPPNSRSALLACYDGDLHDLPLRCMNQYLMTEGWKTLYLGPQTPVPSLIFSINRNKPDLVVLGSLLIGDEEKFIRDVNDELVPAVRAIGAKLTVGGVRMDERFGDVLHADVVTGSVLDYKQNAEEIDGNAESGNG